MDALTALGRRLTAPVDPRPLAFLRIVGGLNAILCGLESWTNLRHIADPDNLRVPFLPGLTPVDAASLPWFMGAWFAASALLAAGLFTRTAGIVLIVMMTHTLLVDQQTYSNHLYLLILGMLFLVVGNAGACWSGDALLRPRAGDSRSALAGAVLAWKLQISIVYFFAAAAKLNASFLSGEVLAVYWPVDGALGFLAPLRTRAVLMPLACATVAAEFFVAFALWLPALRRLALLTGIGLHAGMILLVAQKDPTGIIVFALASLPPYVLFFWDDD